MIKLFLKISLAISLLTVVNAIPLGSLGYGVTAKESASGSGYILFSPTGLTTRMTLWPNQASHFVAVYYQNDSWYYYNNETPIAFTPLNTDVLVASVDFSLDTAEVLIGKNTHVHGIQIGYASGDLGIIFNQFNGVYNPGEFAVTGSFIFLNQPPPKIENTPAGYLLQWDGVAQHTYFIQYSSDLNDWAFFPEIESGEGIFDYGFSSSSERLFLRLKYTDIQTNDPENADFDGDGLSNLYEVLHNLDPFESDTDGDGTSDGTADREDDGTLDGVEALAGRNPLVKDHPAVELGIVVTGH